MSPKQSLLTAAVFFLSAANAHFELVRPPPLEGDTMNDALQVNAPCGGSLPDLSQDITSNFNVNGDSVAVILGHAQATWLIRATLDSGAAGNWTQLFPIVTQSGRGEFCEPAVPAPGEWVGRKGIISIVCKAPDGLLYQCAAVNFVSGSNTSAGADSCRNGSAVSISLDNDPALASLVNNPATTDSPPPDSLAASILTSGRPTGSLVVMAFMLVGGAALL
ncbi:Copper acquisition factor BIM1-like domain-containing protein [Madurella fahalii]|uniref:Copper acquisition factor BIM1-like domain-containing protein n=1 Tax=Madurella fahalii TaxID=1157608 RepID=A0ABQ0GQ48_9PEZI